MAVGTYNDWPRLLGRERLKAYLGGICDATIDLWRKKGIIPDVLPGTTKTDRFLVDHYLNKQGGLSNEDSISDYDKWKAKRDARKPQGHQESNAQAR